MVPECPEAMDCDSWYECLPNVPMRIPYRPPSRETPPNDERTVGHDDDSRHQKLQPEVESDGDAPLGGEVHRRPNAFRSGDEDGDAWVAWTVVQHEDMPTSYGHKGIVDDVHSYRGGERVEEEVAVRHHRVDDGGARSGRAYWELHQQQLHNRFQRAIDDDWLRICAIDDDDALMAGNGDAHGVVVDSGRLLPLHRSDLQLLEDFVLWRIRDGGTGGARRDDLVP